MTPPMSIEAMLCAKFPQNRVVPILDHFQASTSELQLGNWEVSLLRAGKFVEAVLKLLWVHLGKSLPKAKDFKVGFVISELEKAPATIAEDTVRLTIPRACRFIYEVASNRGTRHDPDEIDPNQMDANAVSSLAAWILAELIRYSQKGAVNLDQASNIVAALSEKKFPVIEEIDGRVYFHLKGLSAPDIALLLLWYAHPAHMSRKDLVAGIKRHGPSEANAQVAVSRLKVVDHDTAGNLKLLSPGIQAAEALLSQKRRAAL